GLNMPEKDLSRDPARTPMQWENKPAAGFSATKPWLRVADDYESCNVVEQLADPESMLCFYRKLIRLRQSESTLQLGAYTPLFTNEQAIVYRRHLEGETGFLIALNLTNQP